ncbi:hypothetical protein [Flexibacterium corallicola]|uniref:hypothetical protein n=1 Tax=Flexibacterium corallicola TaxID=3037259 RepID=UPI00286F47AC|nr:hypothetical protein [Pseudovibrio sp. M1P-2-3]
MASYTDIGLADLLAAKRNAATLQRHWAKRGYIVKASVKYKTEQYSPTTITIETDLVNGQPKGYCGDRSPVEPELIEV